MQATQPTTPCTPTCYTPSVKLERTKIPWATPEERRDQVKDLHAKGYKLKECSRRPSVNVQTVWRDKKKLSLDTWPNLSDSDLSGHVAESIALAHTAVGS
jgi:hypothetical protein